MKQTETKATLARHRVACGEKVPNCDSRPRKRASGASNPLRRLQVTIGRNPEVFVGSRKLRSAIGADRSRPSHARPRGLDPRTPRRATSGWWGSTSRTVRSCPSDPVAFNG
jgi:hypothetical protein